MGQSEMNLDLLKPFDLEASRNNEPVLWNGKDVEFVGIDIQGGIALCIADLIRIVSKSALRMKPLAWCDGKPVYGNDTLYSKNTGLPYFMGNLTDINWESLTWTKPEPVKKTRTVKFLGYRTGCGELVLIDESEDEWAGCKRVPGADVTYEVEE